MPRPYPVDGLPCMSAIALDEGGSERDESKGILGTALVELRTTSYEPFDGAQGRLRTKPPSQLPPALAS